jgi:hypothetical protein
LSQIWIKMHILNGFIYRPISISVRALLKFAYAFVAI